MNGEKRVFVRDPWGDRVTSGHFGFQGVDSDKAFLRIVPAHGRPNIWASARPYLAGRETRRLRSLVLCRDTDHRDPSAPSAAHDWVTRLREFDTSAQVSSDGAAVLLFDDELPVYVIDWFTPGEVIPGAPQSQVLERLICTAMVRAYPERAEPVEAWLRSRPSPPPTDAKDHAWSYMAGWYSNQGCDAFCRLVWHDAKIADSLQDLLTKSGHWSTLCRIAGRPV